MFSFVLGYGKGNFIFNNEDGKEYHYETILL